MLPLVLPLTNPWLLLGAVWRGNRETLKVTAKKTSSVCRNQIDNPRNNSMEFHTCGMRRPDRWVLAGKAEEPKRVQGPVTSFAINSPTLVIGSHFGIIGHGIGLIDR